MAPHSPTPLAHARGLPSSLEAWIDQVRALTNPARIHWCTGSDGEAAELTAELTARGELQLLNPETFPRSHLYRSNPNDVARVEHLTFVCTSSERDAGPNNHWMAPEAAHRKMDALFRGCMRGRTLYVVPYCMGPIDSPYARCGIEITDSAYVVLNMRLMTRMGSAALERIAREGQFVRGLHSTGELDPERRFIMHFPEELSIKSYGSGYGGNALLGKKCHALRIASWQAREEGWLAEHMMLVALESPRGETHYLAAAFPSACGKTNLAMLVPPATLSGWKVNTIGDDIAWLHPGPDGRLYAINPESGYFGVAPGTSLKSNKNAYDMIHHDTLFTNVALTADNEPWWDGVEGTRPVIDWQGRPYDPANGHAAHPNSRFTVAARQNPHYAPETDSPAGVPLSAIIFGGRRRTLAPLVYEARNWRHGVLVGAGVASETTAAATGKVGVLRRDPMAMKPFAGYNFGDYWRHWLSFEARLTRPPRIFHVNWFRQDQAGKFLWPGYGENLRVLKWIIDRAAGRVDARETPIGYMPADGDLDVTGLELAHGALEELLSVDAPAWHADLAHLSSEFEQYGDRLPPALRQELEDVLRRLG
ncbi:MAG TPA: phosphoenolpyruvate carboxykinase (GTP) [Steroidobacteraceae bacterium]|nr:phosphoenolpyruvate carboxykinase (GTP) [Steroidobacteraceae bacterium]